MKYIKQASFILLLLLTTAAFAGSKKIKIICNYNDAEIFQDGQLVGKGTAVVKVLGYSKSEVVVKKQGYFDEKVIIYNDREHPKPKKVQNITLVEDDSFKASSYSDISNKSVGINSNRNEDEVWKIISQAIYNKFDIIEVVDRSSGYMRTAWQVKTFERGTVRTRVIVKICSSGSTSCFQIKVISEIVPNEIVSPSEDQKFKPWDRILKEYENIIPEIQDRVR